MDQQNQNPQPAVPQPQPVQYPPYYSPPSSVPKASPFPAGKREIIFGCLIAFFSLLMCNSILFGGFNLGFAVTALGCILCSAVYLRCSGCRGSGYSTALLVLGCLICAGFARSNDSGVKFIMFCFVLLAVNLGLCLQSGQNVFNPAHLSSLGDPFRVVFGFGLGKMTPALKGVGSTLRKGSPAVKKTGAVLAGLAISIPVLLVMIPLLMSADAAFSGLINLIPSFDMGELIVTLFFGLILGCILYSRGVALRHAPKAPQKFSRQKTGSPLTVNTVLMAVCVVYVAYLVSQLAYFVGGFSGILPEGYTPAQYARRGFFEMALLCMINLGLISVCIGLVAKHQGVPPLFTRILCLFMGLVTVFLVITASAKMGLYISSYGLTRLRLLTEIVMVFLGLATMVVCLWLFVPKMPYMKVILLLALSIGAVTLWADVDAMVAAYNVGAYENGTLSQVDVDYLGKLSDGAVPYLDRLANSNNPVVADRAKIALQRRNPRIDDLRSWNFATALAKELCKED